MFTTEIFGVFAQAIRHQPLPEIVAHHAKRALIDWYASAYPGSIHLSVTNLKSVLLDDISPQHAELVGGGKTSARSAALINGAAAHAAELDDSFRDAMYHPGAATIAAALAAAQEQNLNGEGLLKAIVVGYEVSTRIGVVLGRAHYEYWHSTGTVGTLGAAAAAASAYGLSKEQFAHALATAATFAAGLQQAFRSDSMSKPMHAARAAEAGVLAAKLARCGTTGALDIFEGESGVGQAMSNGPDWGTIDDTLGEDYHITRMTFKNHVGCGHSFAAIDAAIAIRQQDGFDIEDIERIDIYTYQPALDIARFALPNNVSEARFSIPYVVAHALVRGSVRLSAYTEEAIANSKIVELIKRINVHADPEIDAAFPGQRAARIALHTLSDKHLVHFQPNRKGDPEDPLSDIELEEKFLELATPIIGESRALERLADLKQIQSRQDLNLLD